MCVVMVTPWVVHILDDVCMKMDNSCLLTLPVGIVVIVLVVIAVAIVLVVMVYVYWKAHSRRRKVFNTSAVERYCTVSWCLSLCHCY